MRAIQPVAATCEHCGEPFEGGRRGGRFCSAACRGKAFRGEPSGSANVRAGHRAVRQARTLIAALGELDEADALLATALLQISEMIDARPSAALFRELRGLVDALVGQPA